MSLVVAWLVFPAALATLAMGCGLTLERVARVRLVSPLLIPAGLAVIVVAAQITAAIDATAELTAPVVVVLAAAGLVHLSERRQRDHVDWPALAGGVAVFAVVAAPVLASGEATFTGYLKLDDTATFLALTDRVMEHGRSLAGLAPSSYEATLANYLPAYPIGSFLPLGVGARLVDEDPAWLWQPWLAFLAAALALTLNALLRPLLPGARLRALCTFVAAQPALLFGYALWGGAKELAAAWVIALVVALSPSAVAADGGRGVLPLGLATAATVAILSVAGGIWIALPLALTIVLAARRRGWPSALRLTAWLLLVAAILALPSVLSSREFVSGFVGGAAPLLTSEVDIGNLFGRISELQILGVWPSGDFRLDPPDVDAARVLMAVVAIAAAIGVAAAYSRRAWPLGLYVASTTATGLAIAAGSGPWVAAKALAIASPAVLVAACAAVGHAWLRGKRVEAVVVGAAIAGGVLWSNALAYRHATVAPREELRDLERIGLRAAHQGPTLMTDYNPYGARHFLRKADGEGASELRRRVVALRNGGAPPKGSAVDTDDVELVALLDYHTLVLRRSPVASRPPATYRLVWRGNAYEMWQRAASDATPHDHLPLGGAYWAAGRPRCADVRRAAELAGPAGALATVGRRPLVVAELGRIPPPPGWRVEPGAPGVVYPGGSGTVAADFWIPAAGTYRVWLGGSAHARVTVSIDGRRVGDASAVLNPAGVYFTLGTAPLAAGQHRVSIAHHDGGWRPGVQAHKVLPLALGPLVLSPSTDSRRVESFPSAQWRRLCGRSLDWIEVLRGR